MIVRTVLFCLICLLTFAVATAQQGGKSRAFHTEGTFTNITAGPGGDYGGMQIYLTDSDGQFYATVTLAEGVLLPPVLVKVQANIDKRTIEFTLPGENGSRKFSGIVSANGLALVEGQTKSFLKRKCLN